MLWVITFLLIPPEENLELYCLVCGVVDSASKMCSIGTHPEVVEVRSP